MQKCSHPNCNYLASYIITNNHCINEHNLSKSEVVSQFGEMIDMPMDYEKLKYNTELNKEKIMNIIHYTG